MTADDHKKLIGVPAAHSLVRTGEKWEQRKGQDIDITYYDELDAAGALVAKYEVRESTSIYPPNKLSVTFSKV